MSWQGETLGFFSSGGRELLGAGYLRTPAKGKNVSLTEERLESEVSGWLVLTDYSRVDKLGVR